MPEDTISVKRILPCPKCGGPLWFYRVYEEPVIEDEDVSEIGYCEWDKEYVECKQCGHRPKHEWYEWRCELGVMRTRILLA